MIEVNPYGAAGYEALKFEPHLHTVHSDGRDTVGAMFEACRGADYDVVALTDHNTVSGLAEAEKLAAEHGLILVPGVEVTTFHGHAVVLGIESVPEWRDLEVRGMDSLAAEVHRHGALVSIAHPAALGSPMCSGCAWDWPIQVDSVDLWEVFSAPRRQTDVSLAMWHQLLQGGGRVAPVAAGDVHSTAAASTQRVATYVYVRERSRAGVLEALRERRVCASASAPVEAWLGHDDGRVALMGQRVSDDTWRRFASPGAVLCELEVAGGRCVYAERCDSQGAIEAVSAPIWISTLTST